MVDARHPDHGDVEGTRHAVWAVEDIAVALHESTAQAIAARDRITATTWSGEAARAFVDSATGVDQMARSTGDAWVRLASALADYLDELGRLQEEGDTARLRLSNAEAEHADNQRQLARAQADAAAGDPAAGTLAMSLTLAVAEAAGKVQRAWNQLDEVADSRRRLDERAVAALEEAPGPGAAAWVGLAYGRNGGRRDTDEVVDDLLALIGDGAQLAPEDHALIDQFLAMYSADPEVMAQFYDGLGPDGLVALVAGTSIADTLGPGHAQLRTLPTRIAAGLATASTTWDDATAQEWGTGLIDTIADARLGATADRRVLVGWLLDTDGLNPQVAMGALERVEHLRLTEAGTFDRVVGDTDLLGGEDLHACERYPQIFGSSLGEVQVPDLMGSIFGQLTRIPGQVREWFTPAYDDPDADGWDPARTDYWFGQRDWGRDHWEGPAALLDAIVTDPGALAGRTEIPVGVPWADTVDFASVAIERFGGNLHLQVGGMSTQAARDVAEMVGTFVPEVAASFGTGIETDSEKDQQIVVIVVDGVSIRVPALTTHTGNLLRLLGVATTDPQASAEFQLRAGRYATAVLDHVTGSGHPDTETATDLMYGVGGLYGWAYGTGEFELAEHREAISDDAQRAHDWIAGTSGLIPGVSTGRATVDYLIQVASGGAEYLSTVLDPAIVSEADLQSVVNAGLNEGNRALATAVTQRLEDRWSQVTPAYDTAAQTLVDRMNSGYSLAATAANAGTSAPELDVVVVDEQGYRSARDRGDMP